MEAYQIIYGFSEIKSELRSHAQALRSTEQLELWFTFDEGVLRVHDYEDHARSAVLAIYNSKNQLWKYFLRTGSYGEKLIKDICETHPKEDVIHNIRNLYYLHGFIRFRI